MKRSVLHLIGFLVALIPCLAEAQGSQASYNLCAGWQELSRFHSDTDNIVRDNDWVFPAGVQIVAGGRIEIDGQGYDHVPVQGTKILIELCRKKNCSEQTSMELPVTVLSSRRMEILLPPNVQVRRDGVPSKNKYMVTSTSLRYYSPASCGQSTMFRNAGLTGFYKRDMEEEDTQLPSIPAPTHLQASPHSDTLVRLTLDRYQADPNFPIDGFRVYVHVCVKNPFENCRTVPDVNALVWQQVIGPQQGLFDPNVNEFRLIMPWSQPVYADQAQTIVDHYQSTSYVNGTLYYVVTAFSHTHGESPPSQIAKADFPMYDFDENTAMNSGYGCYDPQPVQQRRTSVTVDVEYFNHDGEVNSSGQRIQSPFDPQPQVHERRFSGSAIAYYDADVAPGSDPLDWIIESYVPRHPLQKELQPMHGPFYHYVTSNWGKKLRSSRGYAVDQHRETHQMQKANVVIMGQFGDNNPNSDLQPFYVAAHLYYDGRTVVPIALLAGQNQADIEPTIGMVVSGSTQDPNQQPTRGGQVTSPYLLDMSRVTIQQLPSNPQTGQPSPGRLRGRIEGTVLDIDLQGGEFMNECLELFLGTECVFVEHIPDSQEADWKNKITLEFNLPLYDDRCW